jgi:3',5'-cyclic AMP phosphodiesterase CpdA
MSGYGPSTHVVHVTGLRLFADPARTDARGTAPAAAAAAVLRAAAAERPAPAAVILTGDLAADRSAEAYALAKRLVRDAFPAPTKVLFMPGCVRSLTR